MVAFFEFGPPIVDHGVVEAVEPQAHGPPLARLLPPRSPPV
jgi:hypothetical protein